MHIVFTLIYHTSTIFLTGLFIVYLIALIIWRRLPSIANKHVVITGGSSGIGKSIAILASKLGAHVTIIARSYCKLQKAEDEIRASCVSYTQIITSVSLDVTDYEDVQRILDRIDSISPIFMLVNSAGISMCDKIEDAELCDVHDMMNVNFYGTYYTIKAVIPKMKSRKAGFVVIIGSQASLLGIFGFSAYSSSKFALRGLAESLDMEVRHYNIGVTLALPPDTDTPGFQFENNSKLKETSLISQSAGLYKPDDVASKILKDALGRKFYSTVGLESFLLTTLCSGMAPSSLFVCVYQSVLLAPLKLLSRFYLSSYHNIIRNCAKI